MNPHRWEGLAFSHMGAGISGSSDPPGRKIQQRGGSVGLITRHLLVVQWVQEGISLRCGGPRGHLLAGGPEDVLWKPMVKGETVPMYAMLIETQVSTFNVRSAHVL